MDMQCCKHGFVLVAGFILNYIVCVRLSLPFVRHWTIIQRPTIKWQGIRQSVSSPLLTHKLK